MKIKHLTIAQLKKVCETTKYFYVRRSDGRPFYVNGKVPLLGINRMKERHLNARTNFYSYGECSFMEYISRKSPFV